MAQKLNNVLPIGVVRIGLREGILGGNITATSTAAPIPATALTDRKTMLLRNDSGQTAYVGASNVASNGTNGFLFKNGEVISLDVDAVTVVYVVLATGTGAIYFLEGS